MDQSELSITAALDQSELSIQVSTWSLASRSPAARLSECWRSTTGSI